MQIDAAARFVVFDDDLPGEIFFDRDGRSELGAIETAARRSCEVRPNLSALGKVLVSR